MTDQQITIALSTVPTMVTVLIGILINNARLSDVNSRIGDLNSRITDLGLRMDRRFDEMKELWRKPIEER